MIKRELEKNRAMSRANEGPLIEATRILVLLAVLGLTAFVVGIAQDTKPATSENQQTPGEKLKDSGDSQDIEKLVVDTNLTTVLMTATDRNGQFITTLKPEDLSVSEDGVKQKITLFERETERPLLLALVFDTSGSQASTLSEQKRVAHAFLESLFHADKDKIAIVSFAGEAILQQSFTREISKVNEVIERVKINQFKSPAISSGTATYDSLFLTIRRIFGATQSDARRALIVLTDGIDTTSRLRPEDAVNGAVYANTIVYGIGIGEEFNVNENAIEMVTTGTGGRAFFPRNNKDLRVAFDSIAQELRSQYLIGYQPTNNVRDGKRRTVRIELNDSSPKAEKLRLAYRGHYYVKKEATAK